VRASAQEEFVVEERRFLGYLGRFEFDRNLKMTTIEDVTV
jgi:hypothetical protein